MNCDIAAIWKLLSYSGIKLHNIEQMAYNMQENCVYLYDGEKWSKIFVAVEIA